MVKSQLFLILIVAAFLTLVSTKPKLIMVQELFRHGARYPIYPNDIDKSSYALKDNAMGELTTQGKSMHYLLGKKIYETYWTDLFGNLPFENPINNSKFYIKSTDVNRTIESCQSHVMGIFESRPPLRIEENQTKFSAPLWNPSIFAPSEEIYKSAPAFHPFPIHVEKLGTAFNNEGDFLRAYSPENCPNQNVWQRQNQQTKFVQEIYNNPNFTKTLEKLSEVLKEPVSFEKEGEFYDNFETTTFLGKETLPIFNEEPHKNNLAYMYTLDLYINLFYNPLQIRTTSSNFFKHTLHNMDRAAKNKDVQWIIYSAHDTTVANMLAGMNMTNVACIYEAYLNGSNVNKNTCVSQYPGYSSSLIFELWEDNDTSLVTFKVRYLGEYRQIPFCDYKTECLLSRFHQWYDEEIKIDSFTSNCGVTNDDKQFFLAVSVLEFGVILIFVIWAVLKYLKKPVSPINAKPESSNKKTLSQSLISETIEG